ncbi:hypothetical protein PV328_002086 [Microctonus aethiopoides]|uniref:Uncharacterized protein n=1 Tax=Microctonus aethiopoides TaxID=144406 RepID=A0AA39KY72_9HYME|nr:hypothetical protein PV328_002086 [Microctonus aethiopoides]
MALRDGVGLEGESCRSQCIKRHNTTRYGGIVCALGRDMTGLTTRNVTGRTTATYSNGNSGGSSSVQWKFPLQLNYVLM